MRKLIYLLFFFTSLSTFAEKDKAFLAIWVNEAIISTYTYDYQNMLSQQKKIAHYFTDTGWMHYTQALLASNLPDVVNKNQLRVSAVPTLPPDITFLGDKQWKASLPILALYQSKTHQQKQTLTVTITFIETTSGGVDGLAITSLQAKETAPPCDCGS